MIDFKFSFLTGTKNIYICVKINTNFCLDKNVSDRVSLFILNIII